MSNYKRYVSFFIICLVLTWPVKIQAEVFQDIRTNYHYTNDHLKSFKVKKYSDVFLSINKNDETFSYEANAVFQLAVTDMKVYSYKNYTKIVLTFDARGEDRISEYYYYNDKLYFAFTTVAEYAKNKDEDEDGFDHTKKRIVEDRYYFNKEQMIRWIHDKGKHINSTRDEYKKKAEEILHDAKVYIKINK